MLHKPISSFTPEKVRQIGNILGVDWCKIDFNQFQMGLDVELEHGRSDPVTDITGDDPILTAKIVLAHLKEIPDYYTRLHKMEEEACWEFRAEPSEWR